MQRVLLDTGPDDADFAAKARGGSRVLLDDERGGIVNNWANGHESNHVRRHQPRRSKTAVSRKLGPFSRIHSLWELDLRTREATMLQTLQAELVDHVGGRPTVIQRLLIERCVMLAFRVCQIDHKIMSGEEFSQHAAAHALAWNNSLRRTLLALGVEARTPTANGTDLTDWVASRAKSRLG
jgi:hypothetical protein